MIRVQNTSYAVSGTTILSDINLEITQGVATALVGPNGAGKSTLLSLIARLNKAQSGQITVDDLTIGDCDDRDLALRLSILTQDNTMGTRLTVRDLVSFGRYPHHRGRATADDLDTIEAAISRFDLTDLSDRYLDDLSGGQKQRAFIAMTFAQDTDYILLDEPLNNLDIAASRHLMPLLRDLCADQGKTIIVVLHDLNYAARYADQLVMMRDGQVVAQGTPQEVLTAQNVSDVFQTEADVRIIDGHPMVIV
ncbi:MAG: ATP-binding cassette domain-containing protein [Cognatishimia sp.]|nr:ATP-binding cassette domain-containing protein [Cognatishimia sp.]